MSTVDIIFTVILAFALMRGYTKGLLGTAAGYVAPVAAFMAAANLSDPVRDRLAEAMPAPEAILDILAPFLIFVVVVGAIRLAAMAASKILGLGLSLPSRLIAGAASGVVSAVVLGSFVVLVHQLKPLHEEARGNAGEIIVSPFAKAMGDLDAALAASYLGPPLADLASNVVTEAVAHKDDLPLPTREEIEAATRKATTAAAESLMKMPAVDRGAPRK